MIRGSLSLCWIAALCLVGAAASSETSSVSALVARAPVTWLIVVDDLHLDFRSTGRIRDALKTMVAELILEGDRFAIASTGPSSITIDVTEDRQVLVDVLKKATGNALRYEDIMAAPYGPVEARYRASIAVATAQELLDNVSRVAAGPVAMLYISNGFRVDLLPDGAPASRRLGQAVDVTPAKIREQLAQLAASATRASVRIFAIIPGVAFDHSALYPNDPAWSDHLAAMRGVLQSISDGSGGFAIVDGDFITELGRVRDTMRR